MFKHFVKFLYSLLTIAISDNEESQHEYGLTMECVCYAIQWLLRTSKMLHQQPRLCLESPYKSTQWGTKNMSRSLPGISAKAKIIMDSCLYIYLQNSRIGGFSRPLFLKSATQYAFAYSNPPAAYTTLGPLA